MDLMEELNEKHDMTFIFSTHDAKVMKRARRIVTLVDGKIDPRHLKAVMLVGSSLYCKTGEIIEIKASPI